MDISRYILFLIILLFNNKQFPLSQSTRIPVVKDLIVLLFDNEQFLLMQCISSIVFLFAISEVTVTSELLIFYTENKST